MRKPSRQPPGQGEGGEGGAISEEPFPHALQGFGQGDGGEGVAIAEEVVPDARHAFHDHGGADGVGVFFPRAVPHLVARHLPRAAQGERAVVGEIPRYVAAVPLRAARAVGHGADGQVRVEVVPHRRRFVGLDATGGHVHRDGVVHVLERVFTADGGRCRRPHGQLFQPRASIEETVARHRQPGGQGEGGEAPATDEEAAAHALQPLGQGDGGEGGAPAEERVPCTLQPLGQGDGGEGGATVEEPVSHARHVPGQGDGGEAFAIAEEPPVSPPGRVREEREVQ